MLATKDISLQIDNRLILQGISYQFNQGRIYGIIGPNGAGKSSFLKVISGFVTPTSGKVFFQGKEILEPQKSISVVWQKPYMLQTTVYNNVAYGLKIRATDNRLITKKVREIIDQFGLSPLAKQRAGRLSGGETAKVALARAVAISPQILILDEPTASLDPKSVLDIERIILDLKEKYNMTIIFVTHNMFQAKRIADETLFLHEGMLIEAQESDSLFLSPSNLLTRQFISGESFY